MSNKSVEGHPRVALVVGAGGTVGGRFIDGVLAELREQVGFEWMTSDVILGTSAGSFRAAHAEQRESSQRNELEVLDNSSQWRPRAYDRPLTAVRVGGGRLLARIAPSRPLADYEVPGPPHHPEAFAMTVSKTTRRRARHRLVDSLEPRQIVLASSAVPFAVGPVTLDGELHVDGAVLSPNSADLVDLDAFDVLLVVAPMVANRARSLLTFTHRSQLRHELRKWTSSAKPVVVVVPDDSLKGWTADDARGHGRQVVLVRCNPGVRESKNLP